MVSAAPFMLTLVLASQSWKAVLSPGPVGTGHETTEGDCDACHLVFKGISDQKCLKCHTGLSQLIAAKSGFHFTASKKDDCITCHQDHKGRENPLTRSDALSRFDHSLARFPLLGAHQNVDCARCHTAPFPQVNAACSSCHSDPHRGQLGAQCGICHDTRGWKSALKSKAQHETPMTGMHEKPDCADCHAGGKHLAKKVACAACHERAHGGTKADCTQCHRVSGWKPADFNHGGCTCKFPGKHRTFSCLACHQSFQFTDTPTLCSGCHQKDLKHDPLGECSLCHSALSWKKASSFDHNKRSRFKIEDEHQRVDCSRCHPSSKFRGAPLDCRGCHLEDALSTHGDFGGCEACHDTKGFDPPKFDHAATGFALSGRHDVIDCQSCHAEKTKGYPSRKQACDHCHESPHPDAGKTECASCHDANTWKPSTFDLARHEQTRFPLRAKHQNADCALCHADAQLGGLPLECSGCHLDVHQGKLGDRCGDCHSEQGFKPVDKFDHRTTGFELQGAHVRVACEKCHGSAEQEDLTKRPSPRQCATCHPAGHGKDLGERCERCHFPSDETFGDARDSKRFDHRTTAFPLERRHRALDCAKCHVVTNVRPPAPRCSACHLDPHAGQNTPQCEACHKPDRWRLPRFDHDQAGWPLRGRHMVVPCARCHLNQRWVGLPRDCFDCHMSDALRAQRRVPGPHGFGRSDCRECHPNPWRWRF